MSAELDADDTGGVSLDGSGPFTQCDDCGQVYRTGASHACRPQNRARTNTRENRDALADADDRPLDDTVAYLAGRSDSAYHEVETVFDLDRMIVEKKPACGCYSHKRDYKLTHRGDILERGRYPCSNCSPHIHEQVGSE